MKNKRYRFFAWLDAKTGYGEIQFFGWYRDRKPQDEYTFENQVWLIIIGILTVIVYPFDKSGWFIYKQYKKLTVRKEPDSLTKTGDKE